MKTYTMKVILPNGGPVIVEIQANNASTAIKAAKATYPGTHVIVKSSN